MHVLANVVQREAGELKDMQIRHQDVRFAV